MADNAAIKYEVEENNNEMENKKNEDTKVKVDEGCDKVTTPSKNQTIDINKLKSTDPELGCLFAELDLDGDGTINVAELTRAFEVIRDTRNESAEWKKTAFRRLIMFIVWLVINVMLIGVVTFYIVWSTAWVSVDENGNLVNFHGESHDDEEEVKPTPVVTTAYAEEKSDMDGLFFTPDFSSIQVVTYDDENGSHYIRPQGFTTFERTVQIDGASAETQVVVIYLDGANAVVFENPIKTPYSVDPLTPYSITGATFGTIDSTSDKLQASFTSTNTLRRLAEKEGKDKSGGDKNDELTKIIDLEDVAKSQKKKVLRMLQGGKDDTKDSGKKYNVKDALVDEMAKIDKGIADKAKKRQLKSGKSKYDEKTKEAALDTYRQKMADKANSKGKGRMLKKKDDIKKANVNPKYIEEEKKGKK